MAQMNTDAAVLAKEAANFERISGELKGVIAHVESTAGALAGQWHGQAGAAAQAALMRFHEAAARLEVQELNDIRPTSTPRVCSTPSTDEDQHATLSSAMNLLTTTVKKKPPREYGATMSEQLWNFAPVSKAERATFRGPWRPPPACSTRGKGSLAALGAVWGSTGSRPTRPCRCAGTAPQTS